jgi:hypothetical protein
MNKIPLSLDLIMAEFISCRGDATARIDPGGGLSMTVRVWDLIS